MSTEIKDRLIFKVLAWGTLKSLGFIELHPIIVLIVTGVIKSEEDLKVIYDNATKEIK